MVALGQGQAEEAAAPRVIFLAVLLLVAQGLAAVRGVVLSME